jgi:N-acetylmuramic acid 6-phosphate etherase
MRSAEPITERRAPALADLDLLPTLDLVERINDEDAGVAPAVRGAAPGLAAAVDAVAARLAKGGRLVYVGAGSSGRLALVDAVECGPTFGLAPGCVVAIVAGGAGSEAEAQEAAEDDAEAGAADVAAAQVSAADAVVALSASGRTPYTLAAAGAALSAGAIVVAVTCARETPLEAAADLAVVVPVGPEVIAGSTRMKAGTAQKLVLNTLSTGAMIRLGRTYGNLMVDVVASNEKLRLRARRAVALAAGVDDAEAEAALRAADGEPKTAIVALRLGLDPPEARTRLAAAAGVVRKALEE